MFDDQGGPQTIWEIDENGCQPLLVRTGSRNKGSEFNTLSRFLTRTYEISLLVNDGHTDAWKRIRHGLVSGWERD